MKSQSNTIRKFVGFINNPEESGGYWLPNIQRHFVWEEEQIERLYDSIMREYPIGSLLIWKNKSKIKTREFIENYKVNINPLDFQRPINKKKKMLVLDGQQRLQSLLIGLKGSYNKKELYFDITSGEKQAPDDIMYNFKFKHSDKAGYPWLKFKELVNTDKFPSEMRDEILNEIEDELNDSAKRKIEKNLEKIKAIFCTQENIIYQLVDSIDRPTVYDDDDVVEIFIRANSGGTTLSKSDLMFSLLISNWDDADEKMAELLESINKTGYEFDRDFILKNCLVLLHKGAKYEIKKFRAEDTKKLIMNNWEKISNAIKAVKDFLYGQTFLKTNKQIPSYTTLIPLIYFRYKYVAKWNGYKSEFHNYLLRTSLSGAFSGSSDNIVDKVVSRIKETQKFEASDLFDTIRNSGRTLKISKDSLLGIGYTKKELHLLLNIWYGFNYQPALDQNRPQVDHIFPRSALKEIKVVNPESGRKVMKYRKPTRDQLANLMLLTQEENGAGGKSNILPEEWFADKSDEYLELHLIPKNRELWKLENFEEFIEARKERILEKFDYLIYKETEE